MSDDPVTVILVTHDSEAVLEEALESIPLGCSIICVDNGSRDRTSEIIRHSRAQMIAGRNIGFGRACNIGARAATSEFLLFLNPDARIESHTIERLLEAADRYPGEAVFSPRIEDETGMVQFREATRIDRWATARSQISAATPAGDCCTRFVNGSVFLVRRSFFGEIGGFDPNFFLYFEDDDLSFRLSARKVPMIYVHEAEARHLVSSSSPATAAYLVRRGRARKMSEYYFKAKYGRRAHPHFDLAVQIAKIAWYGLTLNRERFFTTFGRLKGIFNVVAGGSRVRGGHEGHDVQSRN